jgi:preprotein translocase subunit SecE
MARNRQKAKERQARRKAERGGAPAAPHRDGAQVSPVEPDPAPAPAPEAVPDPDPPALSESEAIRAGAPPPEKPDFEAEEDDHYDPAEDIPEEDAALSSGPRGRRGEDAAAHKDGPRFVQFLFAVRAELARVQWPDREALTTLTGVVLGFVLLAGGYLGALDAIFSRLIQAIL